MRGAVAWLVPGFFLLEFRQAAQSLRRRAPSPCFFAG
jgi:hypothetical protein